MASDITRQEHAIDPSTVSTTAEYTVRDQQRMKLATRYFDWQSRMAVPQLGQRVLEIGCGMGNFTKHLVNREMVVGIDIVAECVAEHRKNLGQYPHIQSMVKDILDPSFLELKAFNPDSIVCLNVLEHISDDLKALQQMHAVLPAGGRAVLIIPAFQALYGPIDANLGHYRRYSKKSMGDVAVRAGFKAEKLRYINSVGCLGWWVNARILKRTEQSESQIAFFDSMIVPILSSIEDRVEPPFGQSLFTVLVKT
jgi:SAM-dependent methyltransferase